MSKHFWVGLVVAITAGLALTAIAQEKPQESQGYLTEAGKLQRTLKLTLTGEKVKSTQTWLIDTSGKWTVTTSAADKKELKKQSGNLSAEQLTSLAKDMDDFRLRELPSDVSPRTKLPANLYTVSFGFFTSTYELAEGKALPSTDPARADSLALPADRFAAIVRGIQSRLK